MQIFYFNHIHRIEIDSVFFQLCHNEITAIETSFATIDI